MSEQHILPLNDTRSHTESMTCPCDPLLEIVDGGFLIIHNSFDGREKAEAMIDKKFDLEYQYRKYLKLVNLDESRMHEVQRKETKQAFMAASGMMLLLMRDDVTDIPDENDAVDTLEGMLGQIGNYFKVTDVSNN